MSAEQLIEMLDRIGPVVQRASGEPAIERAALVARIVSMANPDIDNQIELARPNLEDLPEIGLWLTKYLADQAPGKIFSVNNGTGWKVAARLTNAFDPLTSPEAEMGWYEFRLESGAKHVAPPAKDYLRTIELFPGHTIVRRPIAAGSRSEPTDRSNRNRSARSKAQSPHEILVRAQQNLEEAMQALRLLQNNRY